MSMSEEQLRSMGGTPPPTEMDPKDLARLGELHEEVRRLQQRADTVPTPVERAIGIGLIFSGRFDDMPAGELRKFIQNMAAAVEDAQAGGRCRTDPGALSGIFPVAKHLLEDAAPTRPWT